MIPLIPTLGLSFLSFFCSAFVVLRIIIPILPPHPLSSRVAPKEFGLPNFKSLAPADKAHVWLAICDLLALAIFLWEVFMEYLGGASDFGAATNAGSAVRLWLAFTLRQICLLVVAGNTLLHVRVGKPVSFGSKHWVIWAPTLVVAVTSTSVAGIVAGVGIDSLFVGAVGFSVAVAVLSTAAFVCLIGTLLIIRRNLSSTNEPSAPWPPVVEEKEPRPSFATEDIDALKDGSSWITSYAGSRRGSISAFSFSTAHTGFTHGSARAPNPVTGSYPSIPAKSSFWFGSATPHGRQSTIPPVPPIPSPYRPASPVSSLGDDADPFRATPAAPRMGSQSSWLSEPSVSQASMSAWSFPTTVAGSPMLASTTADVRGELLPGRTHSRPVTPAMSSAQVLGGYGYSPTPVSLGSAEKGIAAFNAAPAKNIDVSIYRIIGWLVLVWFPLGLSLPYMLIVSPTGPLANTTAPVFLILSITLSAPILAFNIVFSPMPIPSGLFETHSETSLIHAVSPIPGLPRPSDLESRYKRSGSVTVVEGRRSGDVWISKGDAVDGKGKIARAMTLLSPVPKLSVLPPSPGGDAEDGEVTPPLPLQMETPSPSALATPQSENSVEIGRRFIGDKNNSYYSAFNDSLAVTTRIMTAERHYSALAKTIVVPPSPDKRTSTSSRRSRDIGGPRETYTTAAETTPAPRGNMHLRSRSSSSIIVSKSSVSGPRSPLTPPPSSPLPPTPPRRALQDNESPSSGFSFNAVDDINEIDSLSAKLLPLLVPGLKLGNDIRVKDSPVKMNLQGFNSTTSFSSPESTSTPVRPLKKKSGMHKKHHMSLPSLGLRDGAHSLMNWTEDITRALASKSSDVTEDGRRKTVWGGNAADSLPNRLSHVRPSGPLNPVAEEDETRPSSSAVPLSRALSVRTAQSSQPKDVPSGIDTARSSMATLIAALELPNSASSQTSFQDLTGPEAESTPRDSRLIDQYNAARSVNALTHDRPISYTRRSSIVYIKSDENAPNPAPAQRLSGRAPVARQVVPKAKRFSSTDMAGISNPVGSPGLRTLSLLQQRDTNVLPAQEPRSSSIKPLNLTKKDKYSENSSGTRKLMMTPKNLARSATSKARGLLRKEEVLPNVVVRPPSLSESNGFAYNFR